jgi:membrane-associated phospholipid phosphatase
MPEASMIVPETVLAFAAVALLAGSVLCALARRAGWSDPSVRRTTWTGLSVAVVLLAGHAVLADTVVGAGTVVHLADQPLLEWFVDHREPIGTGFAIVLSALGGTAAMSVLAVVGVLTLAGVGCRPRAVVVAVTSAGAGLLVIGFKALYGRARPPRFEQVIQYPGYSLPSGHALGSTVVIGIVTAAALPALRRARDRLLVIIGAAVLVLLVGVSRLYLGAHWLTDVLAGWLLGGAWLSLGITALALLSLRAPTEPTMNRATGR